jgi:protease secretion system outer membrane protein
MQRNPSTPHRMPFKRLAVGVLASTLAGLSASAWSMDLLQAYEAARQQDANILASRATAAAGRERLPQARSQLLPSISFGLQKTNNQLSSTTPNFAGIEQTTETNYPSSNQTLSIRQPLYRPYITAQYRQAQAQVEDSEATLLQD